jgi:hypothetical protein
MHSQTDDRPQEHFAKTKSKHEVVSYEELSNDVIINILEFYEIRFIRQFWRFSSTITEENIKYATNYFYGKFKNDPYQIIHMIFPTVSLKPYLTFNTKTQDKGFQNYQKTALTVIKCLPAHGLKHFDLSFTRHPFPSLNRFVDLNSINFEVSYVTFETVKEVLSHARRLTSLNIGEISKDKFTADQVFELLTLNTRLRKLCLESHQVDMRCIDYIAKHFSNLHILDIQKTDLDNNVLYKICKLPTLRKLLIEHGEKKISNVQFSPSLKSICVAALLEVDDNTAQNIFTNCKLKSFNLFLCKASDLLWLLIGESSLRKMITYGATLPSEEACKALGKNSTLRLLEFCETEFTYDALMCLFDNTPLAKNLTALCLSECSLEDHMIEFLAESLPNITSLELSHNTMISPDGYSPLINLKNLQRLDCKFCDISDENLEELLGMESLTTLGFNIDEEEEEYPLLARMLELTTTLKRLYITGNGITNELLQVIFTKNKSLERFRFEENEKMTSETLRLVQHHPTLYLFDIVLEFEHKEKREQDIMFLLQHCPRLLYIHSFDNAA